MAGVGKTTLVQAFTAGVEGRVLLGACERLVTPAPLGPLLDVAGEAGGALASAIEAGRHPRGVALALLDELRRPAVLILEDVHWRTRRRSTSCAYWAGESPRRPRSSSSPTARTRRSVITRFAAYSASSRP